MRIDDFTHNKHRTVEISNQRQSPVPGRFLRLDGLCCLRECDADADAPDRDEKTESTLAILVKQRNENKNKLRRTQKVPGKITPACCSVVICKPFALAYIRCPSFGAPLLFAAVDQHSSLTAPRRSLENDAPVLALRSKLFSRSAIIPKKTRRIRQGRGWTCELA